MSQKKFSHLAGVRIGRGGGGGMADVKTEMFIDQSKANFD